MTNCPICGTDIQSCAHFGKGGTTQKTMQETVATVNDDYVARYVERVNEYRELEQKMLMKLQSSVTVSDEERLALIERTREKVEEYRPKLREISSIMNKIHESSSSQMKSSIFKVFNAVFKSISSKTIEVGKTSNGTTITVGKFGFGLKRNSVSREVRQYDFESVLAQSDEICKALRKNKHLSKWALKLEEFAAAIPTATLKESSERYTSRSDVACTLLLDQRVFHLPFSTSSYERGSLQRLRTVKMVGFHAVPEGTMEDGELGCIFVKHTDFGYAHSEKDLSQHTLDLREQNINFDDSIIFWQLEPKLRQYLDQAIEKMRPEAEMSNKIIDALKEKFGREILVNGV